MKHVTGLIPRAGRRDSPNSKSSDRGTSPGTDGGPGACAPGPVPRVQHHLPAVRAGLSCPRHHPERAETRGPRILDRRPPPIRGTTAPDRRTSRRPGDPDGAGTPFSTSLANRLQVLQVLPNFTPADPRAEPLAPHWPGPSDPPRPRPLGTSLATCHLLPHLLWRPVRPPGRTRRIGPPTTQA